MIEVLAPGKLFLVGEYAVLDGAPAIVAAVDRGVRCAVSPGNGVETPGDDRFARAGLEAAGAPRGRYRFSDWNPPAVAGKAGFGGSAAAVVAACAAGRAAAGRGLEGIEELAVSVHRAVQGSGSGLDVRAAVRGGIRRYDPGGDPIAGEPLGELPPLAVWSGRSASTGARVAVYRSWGDREAFVRDSAAVVGRFAEDPVDALAEAYRLLRAMAAAAGLDYDTPALTRIAALAAAHGGAAKPSGAGGGDVAVALIPDPRARAAFAAACAAEGLTPLPVAVVSGVRVQEHPEDLGQ